MIYLIPLNHHCPLFAVCYGRAIRVLGIATTDVDANEAMARQPGLSVLAAYGSVALLADKDDMGSGLSDPLRAAGVVSRMLQRPHGQADWTLPVEASAALTALRQSIGIAPQDVVQQSLEIGHTAAVMRGLLAEFDAAFGDAVQQDAEINGADAVDWIVNFAPRVRAALAAE